MILRTYVDFRASVTPNGPLKRRVNEDTIRCSVVPVVAGDKLSISRGFYYRGVKSKRLVGDSHAFFFPDVLYCNISFSGRLDDGMDRRQQQTNDQ